MSFSTTLVVRFAEVDGQGVVFNAHWMLYFDVAFCEYLESLGHGPSALMAGETNFDSMLVHAQMDWRGAAGYRDEVRVSVTPSRLGGSSFDVDYVAEVDGDTRVTGTLTYVSVGPDHRSRAIPDDVRAALERSAP